MVSLHESLIYLTLCDPVVCSIQWHVIQYDHNLRFEILSTCHDMPLRNLRSEILTAFSDMSYSMIGIEIIFFLYCSLHAL